MQKEEQVNQVDRIDKEKLVQLEQVEQELSMLKREVSQLTDREVPHYRKEVERLMDMKNTMLMRQRNEDLNESELAIRSDNLEDRLRKRESE